MRRTLLFAICVVGLADCAGSRPSRQAEGLRQDLASVSSKFELAKKENLTLKKELLLLKKYHDIDTQKFVRSQEVFEKELAPEIDEGSVALHMTDRGLIITALSEKLFVSASDTLSDTGKAFLDRVTTLVGEHFASNYLYIEGHTDNQSLAVFEWKSDWDFSFARALSILKYLSDKRGMNPLQLSASGFGQYRPRASNDTKEGRHFNRRIEIVISPQKIRHASQQ